MRGCLQRRASWWEGVSRGGLVNNGRVSPEEERAILGGCHFLDNALSCVMRQG